MSVKLEVDQAVIRTLDLEAAWEAAEMFRKDNEELRKKTAEAETLRDMYQLRSYGFSRIANIYRRIQSHAITQEMGWTLITEALDDINRRLEVKASA